ncbi:hypothetical protein [Paraburkholderia acidiphila]|uniref:Uncharacterized protein n=1 Tax=Paraburkholderia acidiphila TaxID=2571747 RepID=A0A7Z2G706_9BURK|nr:hypothetical protein [Paraburkholderia acidiphila]QGZ56370.1 hypothetical protein FAZ97_15330 [Paraburkholderia acidiphila]
MIEKRLSRRLIKVAKRKQHTLELQKAVKTITAIANQADKLELVRTVVSPDTVVVKVQKKNSPLRGITEHGQASASAVGEFVDQSIRDTERAIRTLNRSPSDKVKAFYESLAAQG